MIGGQSHHASAYHAGENRQQDESNQVFENRLLQGAFETRHIFPSR